MATVRIIPASVDNAEKLRVAAYCRVSSDSADQLHSYATQLRAYTDYIEGHEGWELVDIYADSGLTGTRMDKREDFLRMITDCRKGKIDRILVKSISRFARNTKECLEILRELMSLGISIRFEKENIDTKTLTSEMMVSVFGSLAQQESMSISQNQRMSYQRRMERGEYITNSAPYGYRIVNKKHLEIVPDEAKHVQWMFSAYLRGESMESIVDALNAAEIPNHEGSGQWHVNAVHYVLTNEKYIGDALGQKQFTTGFPFRRVTNTGEQPKYYTTGTHPAIISRETFERVQSLRKSRLTDGMLTKQRHVLSKRIFCGNCGSVFTRRTIRGGDVRWCCNRHDNHAADCPMGRIPESKIHQAFVRMYNTLLSNTDDLLSPAVNQLEDLNAILYKDDPKIGAINLQLIDLSEQAHKLTVLKGDGFLDEEIFRSRMGAVDKQITKLRKQRNMLREGNPADTAIQDIMRIMEVLRQGPEKLYVFDEVLFEELVDKITIHSKTEIEFHLPGGISLTETL